ncbi:hypothetical protein VNO77_22770 [Canavalia gladiata]|uniref:Uncharacterized protein n=1 Tax=Canavalia gladiata TaxID=3824 RepID=A0AAN9QAW5_CANGL
MNARGANCLAMLPFKTQSLFEFVSANKIVDEETRRCAYVSWNRPSLVKNDLSKFLNTKVWTPSFKYDHSHYQLLIRIELDQTVLVELTEHGYTHTEKGLPSTFMQIQGILEFTKPDSALVLT